jgi:hypothetical protein
MIVSFGWPFAVLADDEGIEMIYSAISVNVREFNSEVQR